MQPRISGYNRDKLILNTLEEWRAMSIKQIWYKFFPFPSGERKAQQRMKVLFEAGKVIRWNSPEGYCYSVQKEKPYRADHAVAVNWIRMWLEKTLASWEVWHYWDYEVRYPVLQADGFAVIRNVVDPKRWRLYFVEMDLKSTRFDKVKKYNKFFKEGDYVGNWWTKVTDLFPRIMVVTTLPSRKDKILDHIESESMYLTPKAWEVLLLGDLQKEVKIQCGVS